MMSKLEKALEDAVEVYHKYSNQKPNPDDNLQKHEFKQLLKHEAKSFLKCTLPRGKTEDEYIEDLFQKADKNRNGFIHFEEFASTMGNLAIHAHKTTHEPCDPPGHGHGHGHGHGPH